MSVLKILKNKNVVMLDNRYRFENYRDYFLKYREYTVNGGLVSNDIYTLSTDHNLFALILMKDNIKSFATFYGGEFSVMKMMYQSGSSGKEFVLQTDKIKIDENTGDLTFVRNNNEFTYNLSDDEIVVFAIFIDVVVIYKVNKDYSLGTKSVNQIMKELGNSPIGVFHIPTMVFKRMYTLYTTGKIGNAENAQMVFEAFA